MVLVPHVGHATAHAGCKVASRLSQHDHAAPRHVLAAMVPHALYHGDGTRVAHGEPLSHGTVDVHLASRGPVEQRVARDGVLLSVEVRAHGRHHRDASAAQRLAQVIVGLALQFEADALGQERAEALSCRPFELDVDGLVGQSGLTVARCHGPREHRAHRAVRVRDGIFQ